MFIVFFFSFITWKISPIVLNSIYQASIRLECLFYLTYFIFEVITITNLTTNKKYKLNKSFVVFLHFKNNLNKYLTRKTKKKKTLTS